MDLGAPLLDVEQSVTSDATTRPEATVSADSSDEALEAIAVAEAEIYADDDDDEEVVNSEPVSIISGGVVEAEGFDPIVITLVSDREDDSDGSLAIVESDTEELFIS